MSQARLTSSGRRGSEMLVVVSTSHMRLCGREAAAEHERQAAAGGFSSTSGSLRRSSYSRGQQPQMPKLEEQTGDQEMMCDVSLSYDEESRSPVVHVIHHGNKTYLEQVVLDASPSPGGGTRPLSYQTPRSLSRSPSPHSRPSSPFARPATPIARPSSPKFRAMSPVQAARLSLQRRASPSFVGGAMSRDSALSVECRYANTHGRASTLPSSWFPPSSRRGSTNTMLKIVKTCNRCMHLAQALSDEDGGAVAVQRRTEVENLVPMDTSLSRRQSSATAAIVAAAASAAGFQLEANGTELQPCLDCLEEFVRRKRVERRESGEASAYGAEDEDAEVIMATTTTARVSTTEMSLPKRRSMIYGGAGSNKASNAPSECAKSPARHDAFSISPQSPSPYRCSMCNACKSCGHTPPPGRK